MRKPREVPSLSPSEGVPTGSQLMGHERGRTHSAGLCTIPAFSTSFSDAYSLCTCHSRAPVFPGATVTAGARVNNRSNHTVGGLGDYSVEAGVNLETARREGCSPLPISWFYLQAANVSAPSAAFTLTSFPDADRVSSVRELSLPSAACRKTPC